MDFATNIELIKLTSKLSLEYAVTSGMITQYAIFKSPPVEARKSMT